MRALLAMSLCVLACNQSAARESQLADLGQLELEIPEDWQIANAPTVGAQSKTWTPQENTRKESIVVVRTEVDRDLVAPGGASLLETHLQRAQTSLARARIGASALTRTEQGFEGVTLTVDFVPPGQTRTYHRVHTVLRDKEALVHVIYTALTPDPERVALDMTLATLRRKDG